MFYHSRLSDDAVDSVLMCYIGIIHIYATRALYAYVHVFRKRSGSALIGIIIKLSISND